MPHSDTDSYDAARKVIPSIKAGREHAAYEIGLSEGRKQSRDEVAALRADLEQTTDERNALLHARTALHAEVGRLDRGVSYQSELVRHHDRRATKAEAELERVTTERDDAYALIRHYADTDPEVALAERMRPVVDAAGEAVDADRQMYHGAHEHAEANMEATFTALQDAVDAYRLATSEQEASRCSCGKPERGRGPWHAPGRCAMYAGALDLPIEASEQEASDATTFHCYVCDTPDGECDRGKHRARDEQETDDA